jgi:hypothetical protein
MIEEVDRRNCLQATLRAYRRRITFVNRFLNLHPANELTRRCYDLRKSAITLRSAGFYTSDWPGTACRAF